MDVDVVAGQIAAGRPAGHIQIADDGAGRCTLTDDKFSTLVELQTCDIIVNQSLALARDN